MPAQDKERNALRNEHRKPIPERTNNKRLRLDLLPVCLQADLLAPLNRQRDVKLNTSPRSLLRAPMPLVDDLKRLLDKALGLQPGMQRSTRDGGGKLAMNENVGVSTDRGGEVRVDGGGEAVVTKGVASD